MALRPRRKLGRCRASIESLDFTGQQVPPFTLTLMPPNVCPWILSHSVPQGRQGRSVTLDVTSALDASPKGYWPGGDETALALQRLPPILSPAAIGYRGCLTEGEVPDAEVPFCHFVLACAASRKA
jgi:hypothetical protein